jgi:DNA-binding GntR family transcriptional regulator
VSTPPAIGLADRSLVVQTFEHLRTAILTGQIPPGTKLVEQRLADELKVSRVPLRGAIPLLEAEGLVRTVPRRGTFVATLTVADVHDLFDVRESLETLAARRAAERVDDVDVLLLGAAKEALAHNRAAVRAGDPAAIAATSAEFHRVIVEMSGNQLLPAAMRPINSRVEWLFRMTVGMDQRAACDEHEALLRAILKGDAEQAATIARDHIARSRKPSVEIMSSVLTETGSADPHLTPVIPRT